ncbi:MAG: aminotransferase class IV [Gemmatales bacterium]|nr:aminotransferase class IV [Gemmatales bacterium]MDW8387194.1 aminotransferase class IV [Gemmatales bacterium]
MPPSLVAYSNGRLLPLNEVRLALHDAGFVFGATVTDLCRTFHQRLYRLGDHLARFRNSARLAHIPLLMSDADLEAVANEVIRHNSRLVPAKQEFILVFVATPGPLGQVFGEAEPTLGQEPTLIVYAYPLPYHRYAPLLRNGAMLEVSTVQQMSASSIPSRIKHRSRLHWWTADRTASQGKMALLLDENGFVTETSTASFVIVRHGCIMTPRQDKVLPGISLAVLKELSSQLGIRYLEADLRPEDCYGAQEAWLCSTPYCLAPVADLDGHPFPCPGPIYDRIMDRWNQEVGLNIREQLLSAGSDQRG